MTVKEHSSRLGKKNVLSCTENKRREISAAAETVNRRKVDFKISVYEGLPGKGRR